MLTRHNKGWRWVNLLDHLSSVRELPAPSEKAATGAFSILRREEGGGMRTAGMIDDLSDAALHCPSFSLLWPTIDRSWVWSPVRERDQTRGSPRWHSRCAAEAL